MSETFWIRTRRGVEGPVSRERVHQLVARNQLGSLDEISSDGRTWTRIRRTEFWGGGRAATILQPAAIQNSETPRPENQPSLQTHAQDVNPSARTSSRLSESVSRIEMPFGSRKRAWKLPTMDEETTRRPSSGDVSHAKRNAIVACAVGSILLAIVLTATATHKGGHAESTNSKPTSPTDSSSPGKSVEDTSASPSAEADFPGCEIGQIDLTQFPGAIQPVVAYLTPSFEELQQLLQIILSSPHVAKNPVYSALTQRTRLYSLPEIDVVNAFSSGVDEERKEGWPTMIVLGGAGRFARLVGAVIATDALAPREDIDRFEILFGNLAGCLEENGCVSMGDAGRILDACQVPLAAFSDEAWLPEAKRISMGILLGIMSHEIGHLALGHVVNGSKSMEKTRNQEREADSFANSVGSGEWFAEPMFWGQLYFHLALVLNESDGDNDTMTDHPFSKERLINLIRSNRSLAAKCGFTEEGMREFLDNLHK